jgi:hypothetical protein
VQGIIERGEVRLIYRNDTHHVGMIESVLDDDRVLDIGIDNLPRLFADMIRGEAIIFYQSIEFRVLNVAKIDGAALSVALAWKKPLHLSAQNPARRDAVAVSGCRLDGE